MNGFRLASIGRRHSGDADRSIAQWGGGWSTDTSVRADVPITPRASIVARPDEFADRVRSVYGKSLQDLEAEWLRCASTTLSVTFRINACRHPTTD
jgi:hypothetical protein